MIPAPLSDLHAYGSNGMDQLRDLAAHQHGAVPHVLESTAKPYTNVVLMLKYEGNLRTLRVSWVNRAPPDLDLIYAGLHVPMGARVDAAGACAVRITWQEIDAETDAPVPTLMNRFATMNPAHAVQLKIF